MDVVLIVKLAGAAIVFAVGIWIGLGTPGLKGRQASGRRPVDRLNATWINRVFFSVSNGPRRFDAGRLIDPRDDGHEAGPTGEQAEKPKERTVRLRRP